MRDRPNISTAARLPVKLRKQLEAIARAENNGVSSVMRRLLTVGLQHERAARHDDAITKDRRAS